MKYVIFLTLLVALGGIIYWRLRPYIMIARRVFGAVRDAKSMGMHDEVEDLPRSSGGNRGRARDGRMGEKLVRCATCGTWLPASRAVALRSSTVAYCSHACLERAADATRSTRRSAS